MTTQDDFPEEWARECPSKKVRVEVLVDGLIDPALETSIPEQPDAWIEIPTTNVKMYAEKGDKADVVRTGHVRFPTEWAGESVMNLLTEFRPDYTSGFQFARIWFWHDKLESWVLDHHGFIGSIGMTEKFGEGQFWVYDFSQMLEGIPANVTFNDPEPEDVLQYVTRKLNEITPVDFIDPLMLMSYEDVVSYSLSISPMPLKEMFGSQSADIAGVTVPQFNPADFTAPLRMFKIERSDEAFDTSGETTLFDTGGTEYLSSASSGKYKKNGFYAVYDAVPFSFDGAATGIWNQGTVNDVEFGLYNQQRTRKILTGTKIKELPLFSIGAKKFTSNRDTLLDVMEWLAEKVDGRWQIEPTPVGGTLVLDDTMSRRPFVQEERAAEMANELFQGRSVDASLEQGVVDQIGDLPIYDTVKVVSNTALYDINPVNTVTVKGELRRNVLGVTVNDTPFESIGSKSKKYPFVKARAVPLYERAKANFDVSAVDTAGELSLTTIESEDITIDDARKTAKQALMDALEQTTEGMIYIHGNPKIMPFDSILAYPMCKERFTQTNVIPLKYEIEKVVHEQEGGGFYTTTLYVSVYVDENDIEIIEARMRGLNE